VKIGELRLTIDRNLESIPLVGVSVRSIAAYCGLDEETASQIELAVVEAANNSVEHSPDCEGAFVEVVIEQFSEKLSFHITDGGEPRSGMLAESLPEDPLSEGGYGLYLINEISDHAEWVDRNGRNCLHFWKSLENQDRV